jgi:DNA-binding NarL/FixJ family response regulator
MELTGLQADSETTQLPDFLPRVPRPWRYAADTSGRVGKLTLRQRRVMEMVLAGNSSKNITADISLCQRTVVLRS